MGTLRVTLLGVGAMNSPRYALLVEYATVRVAIDGGPGAAPAGPVRAWLVTDERAELIRELRRLAATRDLVPHVGAYADDGLDLVPHPVVHTSHPTFGYLIIAAGRTVAWAPEFLKFPAWAAGSDLMLACTLWGVTSYRRMTGRATATDKGPGGERRAARGRRAGTRAGPGLMGRLEERWRRRQQGDR